MGSKTRRAEAQRRSNARQAAAQNATPPEAESPKGSWENFVEFIQKAVQSLSFITKFFSGAYNYFFGKNSNGAASEKAKSPASSASFGASRATPRATSQDSNAAWKFFASLRELFAGNPETPAPKA